jgi:predicted DsbA family dithiol-disulfide isomerase
MKIDFVSDIACPWCAVGLNALEVALRNLGDEVAVDIHFEPFELNPGMAAEGADTAQYLRDKYGMGAEQLAKNQTHIRERGAEVGFAFGQRHRVWNTFDAHRLLMWAGEQDQQAGGAARHQHQRQLKHALLQAYHGEGRNPGSREVLLDLAARCGLDAAEAAAVLDSTRYADAVREREQHWQRLGIHSVPAVIINDRHLISGGQPAQVFEQALRQIAAQA